MRLPIWLACCVAAGAFFGPGAVAQTPAPALAGTPTASATPTLADAVEAAWRRAVAARDADALQRHAQAEGELASAWWAGSPALELGYRHDRWHRNQGERETEIAVSLPLWLPGQRAAHGAVADAGRAHAQHAREAARLRVAGEVREAAWSVLALQSEHRQAEALVGSLTALARDVERRVEAGDLAPADALAARAEVLGATATQADTRRQWTAALRRWTVLTGLEALPADLQPRAGEGAAPAPGREPAQGPAAPDGHPELRLATAVTERARQRLALLDASRREAPELTVGLRREVPGRAEPSQASIGMALRLPLGSAARNRPLEAQARSELDVAQTAELRLRERLEAELQAARDAEQAARLQWQTEGDRAALLRERAALIDRSFRAGESALPELLRALAAAAQADAALARQQAALGLARARTQQALGLLP